jgi:streptogramin lyase
MSAGRVAAAAFVGLAALAGLAAGQVITDFTIPTLNSQPQGIVGGPDGNLWICEVNGNKIARLTTAGVFTEFPIPTPAAGAKAITVGPDGNLWFAEQDADQIGRITPQGTITEFPIPTVNTQPNAIAAGPDGNVWFPETNVNKVARITPDGVVTEFPVITGGSGPSGATGGADGNVWFIEFNAGNVVRVTKTGSVTEFPIPTPDSNPYQMTAGRDGNVWFSEGGFAAGGIRKIGRCTPEGDITEFSTGLTGTADYFVPAADGNLWFTEYWNGMVGRITEDGTITEFPLGGDFNPFGIAAGSDAAVWFVERFQNKVLRITTGPAIPAGLDVDARSVTGTTSNANGILEAGETVQVAPHWTNTLVTSQALTGAASNLTGPAGPTYTINDASADYGTVAGQSSADCNGATGDCYLVTVSGSRPTAHWDATFTETISPGTIPRTWTLHVGGSFPDVPISNQFYAAIENLFHNGITGGCAGGGYCPASSVTRAQMAVFLMKSKLGATNLPPAATGTVFLDVPESNPFAPAIEQLAGFRITGGCGGGDYCPDSPVTRAQMAVFLLKAEHGSGYTPPTCTGVFGDVVCPSQFADWIEQLAAEGITGGCGGGDYCPNNPSTRGQMAVFLVKTFGLQLYGSKMPPTP